MFRDYSVLLSLSGWALIVHCPQCGPKRKSADELLKHVHGSVELRKILPRIVCSKCSSVPVRIEAECEWARIYRPITDMPREDLTWLVEPKRQAA